MTAAPLTGPARTDPDRYYEAVLRGRYNCEDDHCPVPAASIVQALGEAGMAAITLAEADLAAMTATQVRSLLTELIEHADADVAEAAASAEGFLCREDQVCWCGDRAFARFVHDVDNLLTVFGPHDTVVARRPHLDSQDVRIPDFGSPSLGALATTMLGRSAYDGLDYEFNFPANTASLTFRRGTRRATAHLVRVPRNRSTLWAQWVAWSDDRYTGPEPTLALASMRQPLVELITALTNGTVDVAAHLPASLAGDPDHDREAPAVWMALEHAGLTTAPDEEIAVLAAVAATFTGTLDELVAAVTTAGRP